MVGGVGVGKLKLGVAVRKADRLGVAGAALEASPGVGGEAVGGEDHQQDGGPDPHHIPTSENSQSSHGFLIKNLRN